MYTVCVSRACTHGLAGRGDGEWRHVATGCTVLVETTSRFTALTENS